MISFKRKKERNNRDKSYEIVWSLTRTTGPHSERERERERVITPLQWWKKTGNDGHLYKSGFPHGFP
jgi:hypothetical protein